MVQCENGARGVIGLILYTGTNETLVFPLPAIKRLTFDRVRYNWQSRQGFRIFRRNDLVDG